MKAKLIVEGKEFEIEIHDPELQKLVAPSKKTGYERVNDCDSYFYVTSHGKVDSASEYWEQASEYSYYKVANYYSDSTVAENNARADTLMRQLRRFAVERREFADSSHTTFKNERWIIVYDDVDGVISAVRSERGMYFGMPWFNSEIAALTAIKWYMKELIWYFTEYKDSL